MAGAGAGADVERVVLRSVCVTERVARVVRVAARGAGLAAASSGAAAVAGGVPSGTVRTTGGTGTVTALGGVTTGCAGAVCGVASWAKAGVEKSAVATSSGASARALRGANCVFMTLPK